jgi:phage terminase large subunit-like protein
MMPFSKEYSGTIKLEPWQVFFLSCIFAWKWKIDKTRKHTEVVLEIPRKSGKSEIAAIIGLYVLTGDDNAPEIVCGATSKDQALKVFTPATTMVQKSPGFMKAFLLEPMASKIMCHANSGVFEPQVFRGAKEGGNPSLAIVDEYHQHPNSDFYDAQRYGQGSRRNPLMLIISTTGDSVDSPLYAKEQECIRVLTDKTKNDALFSMLFKANKLEDWDKWETWLQTNPMYGVSQQPRFLEGQYKLALEDVTQRNKLLSRHLCLWAGGRDQWLDTVKWKNNLHRSNGQPFHLEEFKGVPAIVSYDLATRIDIAAQVILFQDTEAGDPIYYVFHKSYVPEAALLDKNLAHYRQWVEADWMSATPGDVTDLSIIEAEFFELADEHQIEAVVFDQVNLAVGMQQSLQQLGFNVVMFKKTSLATTTPMNEIEGALTAKRLRHQDDPCLTWQLSNVRLRLMRELKFPIKDTDAEKIDAADALIAAIGTALAARANGPLFAYANPNDEILFA